jgi:Response regulator receiver domain
VWQRAIRLIDDVGPDLVLLDVSLPECSGLEVLARVNHEPEVVFTTAFRDHAVEAVELGAADYLLKPFGRERLAAALGRVRERGRSRDTETTSQRVTMMRDDGTPLDRLFVRDRAAILPVSVDAIVRLETDGDYTAVLTDQRRFLVAVPLGALRTDPTHRLRAGASATRGEPGARLAAGRARRWAVAGRVPRRRERGRKPRGLTRGARLGGVDAHRPMKVGVASDFGSCQNGLISARSGSVWGLVSPDKPRSLMSERIGTDARFPSEVRQIVVIG